MYDIVCQTGRRMFYTTSYINIRCRTLYIRHRMSVLKAPSIDFKFSKDPHPMRVHMAIGFPRPCSIFYSLYTVLTCEKHGYFLHKKWLLSHANSIALRLMNCADPLTRC